GQRCSTACVRQSRNAATDIRLMSSLTGTAPSPACPSTKPSSRATEFTWRVVNWRQGPSTSDWQLSADWLTKLRPQGCSAPNAPRAYVVSRELKNWGSGLGIG